MEAPVFVAIMTAIGGATYSTAGAIGILIEKQGTRKGGDAKVELDRDSMVNAEVWKLVAELKQDREDTRKIALEAASNLAKMRTDHETLQGLYRQSLERIESLESGRGKDQEMILQLQARIRQMEAGT